MTENAGLVTSGLGRVGRNKRYILWFFLMNLCLAWFAGGAFRQQASVVLNNSLHAGSLVQGFSMGTLIEMFARPEFGPNDAASMPALGFSFVFLLATMLFLPGVLLGFASKYRLPREDFFRACGNNLWRFIRLQIIYAIIAGIVAGGLFAAQGAIVKAARENTSELLPVWLQGIGLLVIFLIMTVIRIWFDLAQVDMVLSDQRAVRRSIGAGFRHTFRSFTRLLAGYVFISCFAAIVLGGGIWLWVAHVPANNILQAALVSQTILLLLLIARFWQRGAAVSYYLQRMAVKVEHVPVFPVTPVVAPVVVAPVIVPPAPEVV